MQVLPCKNAVIVDEEMFHRAPSRHDHLGRPAAGNDRSVAHHMPGGVRDAEKMMMNNFPRFVLIPRFTPRMYRAYDHPVQDGAMFPEC